MKRHLIDRTERPIVLNDLGSSVFYVGGIVEQAIGPSAPWFILGVLPTNYL